MSAPKIWIVTSRHINPNDFYVKVDGSEFYTAYWVANTNSASTAEASVIEATEELDLGQVEIQHTADYLGQSFSDIAEVNIAIEAAVEKYKDSNETQLAAWISSQGGKW